MLGWPKLRPALMPLMAASAAINLLCGSSIANAQSSDRTKALEDRLKYLEERLRRVERALQAASAPSLARQAHATKRKARQQSEEARRAAAKPEPKLATIAASSAPEDTQVVQATSPPSSSASPPPVTPGVGEKDEAPQELNVLRENTVTLKPTRLEISDEIDYLRNESLLQNDRAFVSNANIRYGVLDWLELSALIPVGHSTRTTILAGLESTRQNVSGFGDLVIQTNARVHEQTSNWPGVVVSLGMIVPTGASPYDFTGYSLPRTGSLPNPRNPLAFYYSQGAWGIHSNLQFYKTVDPVILFAGFGADYIFPNQYSGFDVSGFLRYNYNFGLSFALSEKTTLGFSILGTYTPDLRVNGRDVFQSSLEPTIARVTVIQRLMKGVWLEPSVAFGMDQDAPNFGIGLGLRARF